MCVCVCVCVCVCKNSEVQPDWVANINELQWDPLGSSSSQEAVEHKSISQCEGSIRAAGASGMAISDGLGGCASFRPPSVEKTLSIVHGCRRTRYCFLQTQK